MTIFGLCPTIFEKKYYIVMQKSVITVNNEVTASAFLECGDLCWDKAGECKSKKSKGKR